MAFTNRRWLHFSGQHALVPQVLFGLFDRSEFIRVVCKLLPEFSQPIL